MFALGVPALFVPNPVSEPAPPTSANFSLPLAGVSESSTDSVVIPHARCARGFEPGVCV